MNTNNVETAVLGGGCFWCLEAVYKRLKGVTAVRSGYAGGTNKNPTYREVCTGDTGHAETVEITYDPEVITYPEILDIFWKAHDPTVLNRQGADVGTQYRSIILYLDSKQKQEAEESLAAAGKSGAFPGPIVTEIQPLTEFFEAEEDHQDYFDTNREAPYCRMVIDPKLRKLGLG